MNDPYHDKLVESYDLDDSRHTRPAVLQKGDLSAILFGVGLAAALTVGLVGAVLYFHP